MNKSNPIPVAYSYVRFSTPEQAQGDSLRRQTEAAAQWCKAHGVHLDTSLFLVDKGVSGHSGKHRRDDKYCLAQFLKAVEKGRVLPGNYLLIEQFDRLTREEVQPALLLVLGILQAGIRIVPLNLSGQVYTEKSDGTAVIIMIVELMRGHSESKNKSIRNKAAWVPKRQAAREGKVQPPRRLDGRVTQALTARLPAWVAEKDGKLVLIKEKAKVVRRIFELAITGYGVKATIRELEKAGIKPLVPFHTYKGERKPGTWNRTYVGQVLNDRRAIGEFQPRLTDGTPDGDPIPDYYPAVVTEEQWHAARAAAAGRKNRGGRPGKNVNLFSGLLKDAREKDGSIVYVTPGGKQPRALVNLSAVDGRAKGHSFPMVPFEDGLLSALREVTPRDILPPENGGVDEVLVLTGKLADNEARSAAIEAELVRGGQVAALSRVLRQLEAEHKALAEQLAEAKQKASSPLGEAWQEFHSLAQALAAAPNRAEARVRLRQALRRTIEGVWCLFTGWGRARLAYVQVYFTGGRSREYLLYARPAHGSRDGPTQPAAWSVASWSDGWGTSLPQFTLKDNPRRAEAIHLAFTPIKGDKPIPPDQWDSYVSEAGEPYFGGTAELVEAMRAAATPEGGSPDRKLIGRLVQAVLGWAAGQLPRGRPAVE